MSDLNAQILQKLAEMERQNGHFSRKLDDIASCQDKILRILGGLAKDHYQTSSRLDINEGRLGDLEHGQIFATLSGEKRPQPKPQNSEEKIPDYLDYGQTPF